MTYTKNFIHLDIALIVVQLQQVNKYQLMQR